MMQELILTFIFIHRFIRSREETNVNRLLTVEQVSRLTGWRPATIRQKVWRRELPYIKLGRSVRFRESEITKFLEGSAMPALESQSR